MSVYWLSFCDVNRPKGDQFVGACIVEALSGSPAMAIREAFDKQCNPGGECQLMEFAGVEDFPVSVMERYGNRLLSRVECHEADAVLTAMLNPNLSDGGAPADEQSAGGEA